MIDVQFRVGHRETLAVQFVNPSPPSVRETLAALPGVTDVELVRTIPVRLRHGARSRTVALTALEPAGRLHRLVELTGRTFAVPPDGLVLSAMLAEPLAIRAGDSVEVELLETGVTRHAVVASLLDELMSPNAYADIGFIARLVGERELATGAYLRLDAPPPAALFDELRTMPRVMSVSSRVAMLEQFDRMMARGFRTTAVIVVIFAAVIALGVVYNGARIALSERGRELASLRVLGFTTREVGAMLLGEQAILTIVAIPLGWALGRVFAGYLAHAFESEYYQVPIVTLAATYIFASAVVLAASAFAGVLMYRRTTRLDLVAVLKTRE
jgi:putative ABC transport system permease protein